jgi:DNA polymerase-4
MERNELIKRYGSMGARLYHLARGEDIRPVSSDDEVKSVSSETTFNTDISGYEELERILWNQCDRVSFRAKADHMAGRTVTLKLKTADFKLRTRATSLDDPTFLAHRIFEAARPLLRKEATGIPFRLLGVGISHLVETNAVPEETSLDATVAARTRAEMAVDRLREKFGRKAVARGIAFKREDD